MWNAVRARTDARVRAALFRQNRSTCREEASFFPLVVPRDDVRGSPKGVEGTRWTAENELG